MHRNRTVARWKQEARFRNLYGGKMQKRLSAGPFPSLPFLRQSLVGAGLNIFSPSTTSIHKFPQPSFPNPIEYNFQFATLLNANTIRFDRSLIFLLACSFLLIFFKSSFHRPSYRVSSRFNNNLPSYLQTSSCWRLVRSLTHDVLLPNIYIANHTLIVTGIVQPRCRVTF